MYPAIPKISISQYVPAPKLWSGISITKEGEKKKENRKKRREEGRKEEKEEGKERNTIIRRARGNLLSWVCTPRSLIKRKN